MYPQLCVDFCYRANLSLAVLSVSAYENLYPLNNKDKKKGGKYFRGECFCADDPGTPGNASYCRIYCNGDPTAICGGENPNYNYTFNGTHTIVRLVNYTLFNSVYGTGR